MFYVALLLCALHFAPNRAVGCSLGNCQCPTSTWGSDLMDTEKVGEACQLRFCFGGAPQNFPLTDPAANDLISQNCGGVLNDNQIRTPNFQCTNPGYVRGFGCEMCGCTAAQDLNITWQPLYRAGRVCRAFRCVNVGNHGGGTNYSCGGGDDFKWVPRLGQGANLIGTFGYYSGWNSFTGGNIVGEYSEFDKGLETTYTCPPDFAGSFCANNPDGTLTTLDSALYYKNTSVWFKAVPNTTISTGCSVYTCNGNAWGTALTFTDGMDLGQAANAAQLAWVQSVCAVRDGVNLHLESCIATGTNMRYWHSQSSCHSRSVSSICNRFKCLCPSNKANSGDTWYIHLSFPLSRPPGTSGMTTLSDQWTSRSYCARFQCNSGPTIFGANYTSYFSRSSSSYNGPVEPCNFDLGYTNAVAKYWTGSTLAAYPLLKRASVFEGRPTATPGAGSNATCDALGTSACYEVMPYYRTERALSGCPLGNSLTSSCLTDSECQLSTDGRAPTRGVNSIVGTTSYSIGSFVGYKIQCFADGQNRAMQPYCMKSTQYQNAWETADRCLNTANYIFNLQPKAQGSCTGTFRDYRRRLGQCDHPIFTNFIKYYSDCLCTLVRDLSAGSNIAGKDVANQDQFETFMLLSSGSFSTDANNLISTLATNGCKYVPIKCSASGQVSFTVERTSVSGTLRVRSACQSVNVYEVQRQLNSYYFDAGIVADPFSYETRGMQISNIRVGTTVNDCLLDYKAYVTNRVWANYINGNLTASGNGGALWESITGNAVNVEVTAVGGASAVRVSGVLMLAMMALWFVVL